MCRNENLKTNQQIYVMMIITNDDVNKKYLSIYNTSLQKLYYLQMILTVIMIKAILTTLQGLKFNHKCRYL